MSNIVETKPRRKLLKLKLEKPEGDTGANTPPRFLIPDISVYMVWCPDGYLPKRVYEAHEKSVAISHAKTLAETTGRRFYVMRSWRGYYKPEVTAGEPA